MLRTIFIAGILMLSFFGAIGQNTSDSLFLAQSKSKALAVFDKNYDAQLPINKGVIFRPIDSKIYYGSTYLGEGINKGNVLYRGEWYPNVDLVYDMNSDNLIHVKQTGEWITLMKDEIKSFSLGKRNFISTKLEDGASGFYELIFSAKNQLLAKHSIKIGNYNTKIFRKEIKQKVNYIINNKNVYYEIFSKSDVLRAFKDKRNEVANYIKKENLDFNDDLETSIKKVMIFYDKLN